MKKLLIVSTLFIVIGLGVNGFAYMGGYGMMSGRHMQGQGMMMNGQHMQGQGIMMNGQNINCQNIMNGQTMAKKVNAGSNK